MASDSGNGDSSTSLYHEGTLDENLNTQNTDKIFHKSKVLRLYTEKGTSIKKSQKDLT